MKRIIKHKFNAIACEEDGIKFESKKERKKYLELKLLQRSGEVIFFLRQVPFHLPGGVKYILDFMIFWADGTVSFLETKGFKTELYKAKKRLVEATYPITITEV